MTFDDRFDPSLDPGDWLFTLVLGLALGLFIAAGWLGWRRPRREWIGPMALAATSGLLTLSAGLLAYDAGPLKRVDFRMKPYLSHLADAGGLLGAVLLGAAASAVVVLGARKLARRDIAMAPAVALCAAAAFAVLWQVDNYAERNRGRHPVGTDRSHLVSATPVIQGLEIPVGLAIAENGDLAVVELSTATLKLFSAREGSFVQEIESRLPIAEGRLGFHVAFHPDYPREPYVYVTAEEETADGRFLQLMRGRVDGASVEFQVLVRGLPAAKLEEGGDHFGSAITFCRGFLFLSTGDTEAEALFHSPFGAPGVHRDEALSLASARGKILRWALDGIDIVASPVAGEGLPIFAYGFRNPFGMTCDPDTGQPIVAENGNRGHDQIRAVPLGSNHEWPLSEERDLLARPLFDSGEVHLAPTGVALRSADDGYELLISTFNSQAVYMLTVSALGRPGKLRLLREVDGGSYSIVTDAEGCAYFTSVDAVWRLDDGRC